jgi:hypothetical protein
MSHRWNRPLVAAALLIAVFSGLAAAETGRTLGGYRFVPSASVEDPFITTRFDSYTGMSWANGLQFPLLVIDTEPPDTLLALSGNYLFVVANFEYQNAVHPRVAVRIAGGGVSRIGTSASALLSQGVTATLVIQGGVTVELWRNDIVLLSGHVNGGYVDGMIIDFVQFAEEIIDGNYESASVVRIVDGGSVSGGLRTAWALNEWAGILGVGEIGHSEAEQLGDNFKWRLAAAGSVDFGQRGNAPVGLTLGMELDHLEPKSFSSETEASISLGAYYTGRDDLNLGIEFKKSRLPLRDWDEISYPSSLSLVFSYFF